MLPFLFLFKTAGTQSLAMKYIFTILCLVAAVTCQLTLPPEDLRKVLRYNTECQKQSGATQQEIMATVQGTFSDSPALKEHMYCMGRKLKLINRDGQIQKDTIKNKMNEVIHDEAKIDNLLNTCLVEGSDPKESAYESLKCVSENRNMVMGS
nr:odorant binding protein 12 [Pagiophloeus tsushimanus]